MFAELESTVHRIMRSSIAASEVMGVNLLVEKDGKTVLYAEEGLADRESGRKITRDTIFRLYSQTKPITAAAVMLLMERGELDLCQPVSDFLPAYAHLKTVKDGKVVCTDRPMLIHDLLGMSSGLVYPDEITVSGQAVGRVFQDACGRMYGNNPMTTREVADRLASCPLLFSPGTSWQYGSSADALGAVIEVVSGKRFSQFLQEEFFDPLEMEDTAFWVPEAKQSRLASVYETVTQPDGTRSMVKYTGDKLAVANGMKKSPAYEAGGAGLASTLDDYMKFARMLLNNGYSGNHQFLKTETLRFFTGAELRNRQQEIFENWIGLEGFTYGNLLRICRSPGRSGMLAREGEYGWDGWLGVYFANFPRENMTFLMGTQKKDSGTFALTRKLRNVVLDCLC